MPTGAKVRVRVIVGGIVHFGVLNYASGIYTKPTVALLQTTPKIQPSTSAVSRFPVFLGTVEMRSAESPSRFQPGLFACGTIFRTEPLPLRQRWPSPGQLSSRTPQPQAH